MRRIFFNILAVPVIVLLSQSACEHKRAMPDPGQGSFVGFLTDTDFEWQDWEATLTDSARSALADQVMPLVVNFLVGEVADENWRDAYLWSSTDSTQLGRLLHPIDFDADGLIDVIYSGPSGGESDVVLLYRNSGGQYNLKGQFMGRLMSLAAISPRGPLHFSLNQYPCCDGIVEQVTRYVPVLEADELEFLPAERLLFYVDTEFPVNSGVKQPFTIVSNSFNLRASPRLLGQQIIAPDATESTNLVARFSAGARAVVLAEHVDAEERRWCFVKVACAPPPQESIFFDIEASDFLMGWTRAR